VFSFSKFLPTVLYFVRGRAIAFYETEVPLEFRVFSKLGAFCRPAKGSGISSAKFAREGANLEQLEQVLF
jgi:hypothetical protein